MRKLTLSIKPNKFLKKYSDFMFEKVYRIELQEILKFDFDEGSKTLVLDFFSKHDIVKIKWPKKMVLLKVLKTDGERNTCLVKFQAPKYLHKMMRMFSFDLIYDNPTVLMPEKFIYSAIGTEKNLKRFLKLMSKFGEVINVSFNEADYKGHGLLNCLTAKQSLILKEALKLGYYKYPREIETKELATYLGISRTTLIEHLRKVENRIMNRVVVS